MKPTAAMFNRPGLAVAMPIATVTKDQVRDLNLELRRTHDAARASIEAAQTRGELTAPLDHMISTLTTLGTDVPTLVFPGRVTVRVIGVQGRGTKNAVPLGDLLVRIGEKDRPAEDHTDTTGLVLLPIPAGDATLPLVVIGPDGNVLISSKVVISGGSAAPVRLAIGFSDALAPNFASGDAWRKAMSDAASNIALMKEDFAKAVVARIRELKDTVARLDKTVETTDHDRGDGVENARSKAEDKKPKRKR